MSIIKLTGSKDMRVLDRAHGLHQPGKYIVMISSISSNLTLMFELVYIFCFWSKSYYIDYLHGTLNPTLLPGMPPWIG